MYRTLLSLYFRRQSNMACLLSGKYEATLPTNSQVAFRNWSQLHIKRCLLVKIAFFGQM